MFYWKTLLLKAALVHVCIALWAQSNMENFLCGRTPSLPFVISVSRALCLDFFGSCVTLDTVPCKCSPPPHHPHDNHVPWSIYWIGLCFQTQIRWCPSCHLHPIYSCHPEIKLSCLPEANSGSLFPPYSQPSEPCCRLLLPPPSRTSGQWSTRRKEPHSVLWISFEWHKHTAQKFQKHFLYLLLNHQGCITRQ